MRDYSSSLHGELEDPLQKALLDLDDEANIKPPSAVFDPPPPMDPDHHHQDQIWDPVHHHHPAAAADQDALLDDSIFYGGRGADSPLLPDFPCMSSSSSSSSTPAPLSTAATMSCSSSSSASSSAALRSDANKENKRSYYNKYHHGHDDVITTPHHHHTDNEMGSNSNSNNCYQCYPRLSNKNTDVQQVDTPSGGALSSTASMEIASHQVQQGLLEQEIDRVEECCMDDFGYMDLLDTNDFFDPCSIFQGDHQNLFLQDENFEQQPQQQPTTDDHQQQAGQQGMMMMMMMMDSDQNSNANEATATTTQLQEADAEEEDLGSVFLEWLKNNKENVSAEDLRRVKIKKSTIDSAARRLGGGREAMKQLLKLVLEWVQTNHLHRRNNSNHPRITTTAAAADVSSNSEPAAPPLRSFYNQGYHLQVDPGLDPVQNPWVGVGGTPVQQCPAAAAADLATVGVSAVGYLPNVGFGMGDPFASPNLSSYPAAADYNNQMIESAESWPGSQFAMSAAFSAAENNIPGQHLQQAACGSGQLHGFPGFPYPYNLPPAVTQQAVGDDNINSTTLVRMGSSATKEARKKRMARQRRFLSHHRNNHHAAAGGQHDGSLADQHQVGPTSQHQLQGSMVYWPPSHQGSSGPIAAAGAGPAVVDRQAVVQVAADRPAMQNQNPQRQGGGGSAEKRQGWKSEKNLRFLLQKVLKQSDVGNLGRIVLPKKEAETHLPELEARDGISIAMEDIVTSRVWNMRYRFWPNNKSRMYLLENTGDFVRANGLQEGDFIVIYSDIKCGKYLIRGVKVRQPGFKPESKKATGKSLHNSVHANSPSQQAADALPVAQSRHQTVK